jgi:hypothetical protein
MGGLQANMTVPLINAKEISHIFPRSANELTCFRNPQYKGLTVSLLNKNLPKLGADTTSSEFYRLERSALKLNGLFTPNQSLENSYTQLAANHYPFRNRSEEDDTDFVLTFPLERPTADAFHSDAPNSSNETINLRGDPKETGEGDIYYILNSENLSTTPKYNTATPICCIVSDSFWVCQVGEHAQDSTSEQWRRYLPRKFSQLYQSLIS